MAKEKSKAAKPVSGEKTPVKHNVLKEITVKVGETEYTGLCVSKRKTNSGEQVFLKIAGKISRWFNAKDIIK